MRIARLQRPREAFVHRWWDFIGTGRPRLQYAVSRIGCWFAGHEHHRYQWCDWCGKDMS